MVTESECFIPSRPMQFFWWIISKVLLINSNLKSSFMYTKCLYCITIWPITVFRLKFVIIKSGNKFFCSRTLLLDTIIHLNLDLRSALNDKKQLNLSVKLFQSFKRKYFLGVHIKYKLVQTVLGNLFSTPDPTLTRLVWTYFYFERIE